jgi:hypothetical protein
MGDGHIGYHHHLESELKRTEVGDGFHDDTASQRFSALECADFDPSNSSGSACKPRSKADSLCSSSVR